LCNFNSFQAAESFFRTSSNTNFTLRPEVQIRDIFTAVQDKTAHFGVVPYENSTNGPVSFTLNLFADRDRRCPEVRVCGKTKVAVRHCLLGHPRPNLSETAQNASFDAATERKGTNFSHIKLLYSHPQAWGQCERFLELNFKGVQREDASSTSKAADLAAADVTGTSAAISSLKVAELCELDVLAKDIQDRDDNVTYFFVIYHADNKGLLSELPIYSQDGEQKISDEEGDVDQDHWRTLITFGVPHAATGAMADVLAVFKDKGLNLTNMHQCPRLPDDKEHIFCTEIQGRKSKEEKGAIDEALKQLSVAVQLRWLGSWKDEEE